MPLAISFLFILPFIILGVLLLAMLVLYLLARIQNGRFLRPIVTLLSKRSAEMMTPMLTAIDFPAAVMGRRGAEMLIQQLEGKLTAPDQRLLRVGLTVRQSSGPYRPRPALGE